MKKTGVVLLLLMMVGFGSSLFAYETEEARKKHFYELTHNYGTHESLYIYTHRPMDVKVEIKKKYLETGVDSKSLEKLKWKRKHYKTENIVTEKQDNRGITFKTSKGDVYSDYYYDLRVDYRRYLLTSDFLAELKKYKFKMEEAAVETAIAVAAGVTAFICPEASEIAVEVAKVAAKQAAKDAYEAVKDFKPYREKMEKSNKHNYELCHYYYKVTIDGHTAVLSQSLIDFYKGSVYFDKDTKTFTKGPKGKPTY